MKPFSILRTQKIITMREMEAMARHWKREQLTPNADSRKTKYNQVLIGTSNIVADYQELITSKKVKIRKNGVLAIEFVLSFSPEFIEDTYGYKKDARERVIWWRNESVKWLKKTFGERCRIAISHFDEKTPHIHALVVPLEKRIRKCGRQDWVLNARGITGGKVKLSQLQDSYALATNRYLRRGIKGSKATHTTIKEFYKTVNYSIFHVKSEAKKVTNSTRSISCWTEEAVALIRASKEKQLQNKSLSEENLGLIAEKKALVCENHYLKKLLVLANERIQELRNYFSCKIKKYGL
jgi:hypothetical protein